MVSARRVTRRRHNRSVFPTNRKKKPHSPLSRINTAKKNKLNPVATNPAVTMASDPNIFTLSNSSLKLDSAEDITPHLPPLLASTTVTEIRLGGNTLGAPACVHLGNILRSKRTLQIANLADIFTARLLSEIPPALSSLLTGLLPLQNLHTVDLSDNAFGLNTQAPLVAFLESHVPLKHLILNNNGLGPRAGILIADALTALAARKNEAHGSGAESQQNFSGLETIICGRNRLESGSMAAWANTFRAHAKAIKVVKMVQNGIRQDGISLLLHEGLRTCGVLRVLDLQDNTFTTTGAAALADVVQGWTELVELGVGDCLLGSRGVVLVAEALKRGGNKELGVLRLQYNEIDTKGVKGLFVAATSGQLDKLRRVELNGNRFSEEDEGVVGLRELLEGRKDESGVEEDYGLDDLSDLEDESDEEDDDDANSEAEEDEDEKEEVEDQTEQKAERLLKEADQAEDAKVSQKKDEDVDDLAELLGKAGIK